MDTPTDTPAGEGLANANVAEFAPVPAAQPEWPTQLYGPDDPPWGVGAALLVWIASVMLLLLVPTLAGVAYIIAHLRAAPAGNLGEMLLKDPNFILISVAAVIPAHLLTIWLVWWLHFRTRQRAEALSVYRLGIEIFGVCIIALTGHLGGFLSGVNGPG